MRGSNGILGDEDSMLSTAGYMGIIEDNEEMPFER